MIFKVDRTSWYWRDKKTCKEAYTKDKVIDRYSTDWFIKITSLKQLLEFSKKYGDLVINGKDQTIEIYDDYRE